MEERIIEIEKKIAYQENTIEQLNQVILDQEKKIRALEDKITSLENQMIDEHLVKPMDEETPPPHY